MVFCNIVPVAVVMQLFSDKLECLSLDFFHTSQIFARNTSAYLRFSAQLDSDLNVHLRLVLKTCKVQIP